MTCYHFPVAPHWRATQRWGDQREYGVGGLLLPSPEERLPHGGPTTLEAKVRSAVRAQEATCALVRNSPPAAMSPGSLLLLFTGSVTFFQNRVCPNPNLSFHKSGQVQVPTAGFPFHHPKDSWNHTHSSKSEALSIGFTGPITYYRPLISPCSNILLQIHEWKSGYPGTAKEDRQPSLMNSISRARFLYWHLGPNNSLLWRTVLCKYSSIPGLFKCW